ncbi:DNA topoisomerase IB [Flavihumibacter petaseus]|uniref:DNA topoisomerase n=1 Tax=Flavihumibacter petaseus NBRC 106054 TaxID=1220578 RepID=A0A0E9N0C0_9BACT|nr:DNA topoisomerase IB [Flavihumibacter petaseus]GAO42815.1 putative DNA topoisomerase I [Flavihumibacter petaseus NBRC 106054]
MEVLPRLQHRKWAKLHTDTIAAAKAIQLVYVKDNTDGIRRQRTGKGFSYRYKDAAIRDKDILQRIRQLAIPPAWENVWICWLPNGHIQATGIDARKRKQYRYHPQWNDLRRETKFHHLLEFGKCLPQLRLQVEKDLAKKEQTEDKVIAAVISLMERTYIRIGNGQYEKDNGSYGLSTMKDQHVAVNGNTIRFAFKGKKGIFHDVTIRNRQLAKIVKACRDIPGRELFQYYNEAGERCAVDSGAVNRYIKQFGGEPFSAKDFRTWAGSLGMLRAFRAMDEAILQKEKKSNVLNALDQVSTLLGNTRTVCKKYYVHPAIIEKYESDALSGYLDSLDNIEKNDGKAGLTPEEQILMRLLTAVRQ